ncbi:MAG: class I tRNA ligase family protein, partial [Anaerolineae bacterium]
WMENIRDWCISRQLWWGHRIPVWYCDACGEEFAAEKDPTECPSCGEAALRQDPDVLDTWFSSGLWPFSTLGWPEATPDYQYFYPTSVLETGYDILFFWVARMIMMGLEFTGEVPFHTVYLHGLVRNERGEKISKSLPDAERYDPINVIEEYGCDALRFALVTSSTPGNDAKLSPTRIEAARNFANKIWNATRYVLSNLSVERAEPAEPDPAALTLVDRWIISRQNHLIHEANRLFEAYQFGEAGRQIQEFLWNEFCDWYIEASKVRLYGDDEEAKATARQVLVYVLERSLRLLHPFMPFVTETLWQALPHAGPALLIASWPEETWRDEAAEERMNSLMDVVRAIRTIRAEYDVQAGRRIPAILAAGELTGFYQAHREALSRLAHLDEGKLTISEALGEAPAKALTIVLGGIQAYLPLGGLVDIEAEQERISIEMEDLTKRIADVEIRLRNEDFVTKAPAQVVQRERDKRDNLRQRWTRLRERLEELSEMA